MKGGCHCGAIKFETKKDPFWVGACYCVDCRRISGAPYTVWTGHKAKEVTVLQGSPKEYASSKEVTRSFCKICGSPFSYRYINSPEYVFIPVGIFDNPQDFKLTAHIWVSQKLPWIHIDDELPQREK